MDPLPPILRRRRSPNDGQAETSGVGEQSLTRQDDQGRIFAPPARRKPPTPAAWENTGRQSNTPFVIDTDSVRVLPANPLRRYLLVQNKSADVMYVNFGQLATVFNGIQISAGGYYELIGGGPGGSFVPADDVYILGGSAGLAGVVSEGAGKE